MKIQQIAGMKQEGKGSINTWVKGEIDCSAFQGAENESGGKERTESKGFLAKIGRRYRKMNKYKRKKGEKRGIRKSCVYLCKK